MIQRRGNPHKTASREERNNIRVKATTTHRAHKMSRKWGGVLIYLRRLTHFRYFFSLLSILTVLTPIHAYDLITSTGTKTINTLDQQIINAKSTHPSSTNKFNRSLISKNCIHNKYKQTIKQASQKYNISESLITAIISTESCFNRKAVSKKGAQGLMQLMPFTAKRFNVSNSFDATENINGGVKYLHFLLKHFNGKLPLVIAAYNAGEGAVDHYQGIPPYKETQHYVKKVLSFMGIQKIFDPISNSTTTKNKPSSKQTVDNFASDQPLCTDTETLRAYTYAYFNSNTIKRYYLIKKNDKLQKIANKTGINLGIINKLNDRFNKNSSLTNTNRLLLSRCKFSSPQKDT